MSDLRALAHLEEQLGRERWRALISSVNTGKVREFCNKLLEENNFLVSIDYRLSLADMITAGKYDRKNGNIVTKNFAIIGRGVVEVKLRLIHLGPDTTTKQVDEHLASLGLVPAKIEHLLAFGAKYPDRQREFPIIALTSGWMDGAACTVPFLCGDKSERALNLRWDEPNSTWGDNCHFLALSK